MNFLARTLSAGIFLSSSSSRKCILLLNPVNSLQQYLFFSTTSENPSSQIPRDPPPSSSGKADDLGSFPRPSEIPYQTKVANSVNLIGYVQDLVQFQASADGKFWAGTVISGNHDTSLNPLSSFVIPVIFEGNLAHVAASHVKPKDCVFVTGHLSMDPVPFIVEGLGKLHVNVEDINFVHGFRGKLLGSRKKKSGSGKRTADVQIDDPDHQSWKDLMDSPEEWWDIRLEKSDSLAAAAAFEHKESGERLYIDDSTPVWILKQIQKLTFDHKDVDKVLTSEISSGSKIPGKVGGRNAVVGEASWRDLVRNSKEWIDYRQSKKAGKLKAGHPDFKHSVTDVALWLSTAPIWVLQGLEKLEFVAQVSKQESTPALSSSWKSLLENPSKWWDNRSRKSNEKSPDFRHKETGEALWLNRAPDWVLREFEGPKVDNQVSKIKPEKHSREDSWKSLLENPDKWWDSRSNKPSEKAPDFKNKDTFEVLWLDAAPDWVLQRLPGIQFSKNGRENYGEDLWKDLVNNPHKWWDYRQRKTNEKAPDFKHKEAGEALWLNRAPDWVLDKLAELKLDILPHPSSPVFQSPGLPRTEGKKSDKEEDSWKNLVENPDKWWDNRSKKTNDKAPDFKHKETGEALWLGRCPTSVISMLPPLKDGQKGVHS